MRIRAAVCGAVGGPVEVREVDLRPPGPAEVLVRITATGVCASDVAVVDGRLPKPMPIVPGHEATGRIAALGDGVEDLAVDDPVVLTILVGCDRCRACRAGRRRACAWAARLAATGTIDGTGTALSLDGAPLHHFTGLSSWAEYAVVHRTGVVRITEDLPPAQAALLGCAVATGFGAVRNAAAVRSGQSVAVIGCGGVGLNVVQAAALAGAVPVIAVDRNGRALDVATTMGATHTVLAGDRPPDAEIRRIAPAGVDHCFEVLGSPATVQASWRATALGGQTTVVGLLPVGSTITLDGFALISEKRMVGTYLGGTVPERDLPELARAAARDEIALDPLVEPITLDELPGAVQRIRDGSVTARQVVKLP